MNFRFLIILGIILFFILIVAYFFYGLQPSLVITNSIQFKIIKGEGFREIGGRLSRAEFLRSLTVFKVYSILSGRAQKFQPGLYELSGNMSVPQIVDALTSGGQNEVTITIPEGSTLKDIDNILAVSGVIERQALISYSVKSLAGKYPFISEVNYLEGFLFPDTYRFKLNSSADEVISRFLDNFLLKAWKLLTEQKDWYDYLILASFLEREVIDFNDRQLVAGILLKRLKTGIPLQVDATISYAKCNGEFKSCNEIVVTKKDLALSSPYNTYQRMGWTPAPISNPGQAAIKAALTSRTSPYFYYLTAKETKETVFARTLEEHNINRVKYL